MSKALLNLSSEINGLCKSYLKNLEIDHFNYIHKDLDNQATYICSNPNWLKHYLHKGYPHIGAFENNSELSKNQYVLWNGLDRNDPILIDSKEMIGIEYGITLIKPEEDGFSFFNIGIKTSEASIINKYINNLNKYENFVLDFQEKANLILKKAKKLKFPTNKKIYFKKIKQPNHPFGNLCLTPRELECIHYQTLGKTAEEISIILNISKRTVETHILNIKKKLNCFNQFKLGFLLGQISAKKT